MDPHNPLASILFFLIAAVIAVPLFRRIGLGAILGYLCAGVFIGPHGMNFIDHPEAILHFAEIGVVLLLFVIGLELNPEKLWAMRRQIALLGGGQLALSALLVGVLSLFLLAVSITHAIVIGLALALSSTAFAIQLMAEKGILASPAGRRGFSILLMQDLAVIPILFIVSSFAIGNDSQQGVGVFGIVAIGGLLLAGRYLLNPMLGFVSKYGGRDIMTAAALLIVVGSALLMQAAGLSMGMGAFIAGIMLANSSFRHQLETDIEPFKALTLGLFFIAIGMTLDIGLLLARPLALLYAALLLMTLKAAIVGILLRIGGLAWRQSLHMGLILSQGGEFAFVIMAQASGLNILPPSLAGEVTLTVGLSMALTAPLVMIYERLRCREREDEPGEIDVRDDDSPEVLILGFGRFGQIAGRILRAHRIPFSALDKDASHIRFVNNFGNKIHFGDATRLDVLETAGLGHARAVLVAIDNPEEAENIVKVVREHHPHTTIIARARNRSSFINLRVAGADKVLREVFSGSLNAASETLIALGYSTGEAIRSAEIFRAHDVELLDRSLEHAGDMDEMIKINLQGREELEQLFTQDKSL
ncbi:MAG: monovalent cation:proton antiporter-2 (CPA2) family protein [Pseudomonadota bacterium]